MLGIDHDFSSNDIEQAALYEGAYEAPFDFTLYFGYRGCIEMAGSVKDDAGIAVFIVTTSPYPTVRTRRTSRGWAVLGRGAGLGGLAVNALGTIPNWKKLAILPAASDAAELSVYPQ